jgi:hypothetical protein
MIAEAVDPDEAQPLSAARLSLPMQPGESITLASEEGQSIGDVTTVTRFPNIEMMS